MATVDLDYTRLDVTVTEQGTIDLVLWDDKAIASGIPFATVTLPRFEATLLAEEIRRAVDNLG